MTDTQDSVVTEQIDAAPQDATESVTQTAQEAPKESIQTRNWRALEEERDYYRKMYEQNAPRQNQQQNQDFDLNTAREDDIPTYGDLKKILQKEAQEKQFLYQKLNELELRSKYSDVDEVINRYLPDALQDEPDLAQAVQNNPSLKRLAYKLAQSSPKYHEQRLAKNNQGAINRIVENSTKTQPATSRKSVAVQNEDARYQNMSDDDIMKNFTMAKARY